MKIIFSSSTIEWELQVNAAWMGIALNNSFMRATILAPLRGWKGC